MKTKQQAIQEAYGEHWENFNETSKKCAFKHDGFIASILEHRLQEIETEYSDEKRAWRPKSLQGIENNNGWIKIDENFEWGKYNDYLIFFNSITNESVVSLKFSLCAHQSSDYKERFTHYQPIEKPKPPIY